MRFARDNWRRICHSRSVVRTHARTRRCGSPGRLDACCHVQNVSTRFPSRLDSYFKNTVALTVEEQQRSHPASL